VISTELRVLWRASGKKVKHLFGNLLRSIDFTVEIGYNLSIHAEAGRSTAGPGCRSSRANAKPRRNFARRVGCACKYRLHTAGMLPRLQACRFALRVLDA
jgi:hypothetical protein